MYVLIALLVVKEAHGARNIVNGVEMSLTLYHDPWLVMVAIIRKGKRYGYTVQNVRLSTHL